VLGLSRHRRRFGLRQTLGTCLCELFGKYEQHQGQNHV
jgi:hypothetical protein